MGTSPQVPNDAHWMGLALAEARRHEGQCAPNPPVGAVVVRDGQELVRAGHRRDGGAHAERAALQALSPEACRGATLYVTLEPCSTPGRTGACLDLILQRGISRVVYACQDPFPGHEDRARQRLKDAGVEVQTGILKEEGQWLLRGFRSRLERRRPWVILKSAMSLDGRITRPPGEGPWLTSALARERVQQLRREVDGILTSGATVRADDPALTLRGAFLSPEEKTPWRLVVSRKGRADFTGHRLFKDAHAERTHLLSEKTLRANLESATAQLGLNKILVEAGGRLTGALFDEGLVDEAIFFYAPLISGALEVAIGGEGAATFREGWGLAEAELERLGPDLMLRGRVVRSAEARHPTVERNG